MKIIKNFNQFISEKAEPQEAPVAPPQEAPTEEPGKERKPGQKPSPIRRDRPGVAPGPKAERPKTATENDVIAKFAKLTNQKY